MEDRNEADIWRRPFDEDSRMLVLVFLCVDTGFVGFFSECNPWFCSCV
jgi:hypothetical protein